MWGRFIVLLSLLTACTVVSDDGNRCDPGPSPVRRLTRFEYNNTVRDLLGDTTSPAADFGAEEEGLGFNNNAASLVTSAALAEKYMRAAELIAERATTPIGKNLPCDPEAAGQDTCAGQFIDRFGQRAFRRPLTADERELFFQLYYSGKQAGGFASGIRIVIEAALQMPQFLYRIERGVPAPGDPPGMASLDDWEIASRLSYLVWGSMPDDELLDAAERGELSTAGQIEAQARRMLADPKAHAVVREFHEQWLDTNRVAGIAKDPALFPEYSPEIGELLRRETGAFVEDVVFSESGTLSELLTAPYTFLNEELAEYYGEPRLSGQSLRRVDVDPAERAGIITSGALLAINAHSNQTSPVHRGKLVREQFLCEVMPPPPPDVMIIVPEPEPGASARERFAEHSASPACNGCHRLMDPIGFGFERYDSLGRFRDREDGEPIDDSGEIHGSDAAGTFDGAIELASILAASEQVQDCYVTQWFRFGYGRGETVDDGCNIGRLSSVFTTSGGNVVELLVALTQSDAFRYRRAEVER